MIDCVSGGAVSGYVAAILCRSVHEERPSSSTSGGQSDRVDTGAGAAFDLLVPPFIIASHAAEDVHVRHLFQGSATRRCLLIMQLTASHLCPRQLPERPSVGECRRPSCLPGESQMCCQKEMETTSASAITPRTSLPPPHMVSHTDVKREETSGCL